MSKLSLRHLSIAAAAIGISIGFATLLGRPSAMRARHSVPLEERSPSRAGGQDELRRVAEPPRIATETLEVTAIGTSANEPEAGPVLLEGRVTDERNRPLEGVTLEVTRRRIVETVTTTTSDVNGGFLLLGLPVGEELAVRATAAAYRAQRFEFAPFRPGERQKQDIVLRRGANLAGRITDANQNPVSGAVVGTSDSGVEMTKTDPDGRFELGGLGAEALNLFVQAQGFATKVLHRVAPGAKDLRIMLEVPASVVGNVTVPGTVDHVIVSACRFEEAFDKEICSSRQVIRAPSDRYDLRGLAPGRHDLVMEADGYPARRYALTVAAGERLVGPGLDVRGIATAVPNRAE